MTEILLLHHVQGLTAGIQSFAETLRGAGHTVHVPDLLDGRTFDDLDTGIAHAQEVGFGTLLERGEAAAADLPEELVYLGISLGVMPAQKLAQTRAGALGALLLESCIAPEEFGNGWPAGVRVQVHGMDQDPVFAGEGDLDAAKALVASTPGAELFVYPGRHHLFSDNSLATYDEGATALLTQRVLAFLAER